MLIPMAYGAHKVRSAYLIDMYAILNTVFMMFVDLKTDCETISRQHKKDCRLNRSNGTDP